jgi:hypothetical protein
MERHRAARTAAWEKRRKNDDKEPAERPKFALPDRPPSPTDAARNAACAAPLAPHQMERIMRRISTILGIVLLSGGTALAQSGGGAGGGTSGAAGSSSGSISTGAPSGAPGTSANIQNQTGTGSSSTPGNAVQGPNNTGGPVPGLAAPSPSDSATVGRAPGVNPGNPQDATRRSNPSDRTLPGASNPQDMRPFDSGTPQIIAPERQSIAPERQGIAPERQGIAAERR